MNFITLSKKVVRDMCTVWDEEYAKNVYMVLLDYNTLTKKIEVEASYPFLDLSVERLRAYLDSDEFVFIKIKE